MSYSQEILKDLVSNYLQIIILKVQKSTLNEIFLNIYGEENEVKSEVKNV